jgi:mono/diheme cytochrome c family protein
MRSVLRPLGVSLLILYGCGGGGEAPQATNAHTDSVALALSHLTVETFDTIKWPSDSVALARGALVWSTSCQRCHAADGSGTAGFVQKGDTLRPPDFRADTWTLGRDREALRRQIYTGTEDGMPHWSLIGLKPRDVDATALYIQKVLTW